MPVLWRDKTLMSVALEIAVQAVRADKLPPGRACVGCVLTSPDYRAIAYGHTGTPSGFPEDLVAAMISDNEWDRWCVHAEVNAIANARRDLTGWALFSTKAACRECAKVSVQAGVTRVVAPRWSGRFAASQIDADNLFRWCGVTREEWPA